MRAGERGRAGRNNEVTPTDSSYAHDLIILTCLGRGGGRGQRRNPPGRVQRIRSPVGTVQYHKCYTRAKGYYRYKSPPKSTITISTAGRKAALTEVWQAVAGCCFFFLLDAASDGAMFITPCYY